MNGHDMVSGTIWKFLERLGVFGAQFVIQIILARILEPSDYGSLAIMLVCVTVSNVIIQNGFNAGIIQRQDVREEDFSSVLWVTLGISFFLYSVIFILAPFISGFYNSPILVLPLRVIALGLFPGAVNSIQIAKVSKDFDFKKLFISNLSGIIISGIAGIIVALNGGGLWALVIQNLLNLVISCVVMAHMVKIKFKVYLDVQRIQIYFKYGWKLVLSGVLNTISDQLNGLIIGYKYTTETLGYYTRGMQFPNYGITIIEGTMTGVLLPAMSKVQESKDDGKKVMRAAITLSTYLTFPLMAGLAAISKNLVLLFLSEKWLACVPYLKIFCAVYAFYPVHICNLQTLNSVGRSDLFLKIEIIKKIYSIATSVLMIIMFNTPMAIAISTLVLTPLSWFVNAYPNSKLINYSFMEQVRDLLPNLSLALPMYILLELINLFRIGYITIIIQVLFGFVFYFVVSLMLKYENLDILLDLLKKCISKRE